LDLDVAARKLTKKCKQIEKELFFRRTKEEEKFTTGVYIKVND